jgi:cell division protein FtsZ
MDKKINNISEFVANIKVVGVGGAGNNAVNRMTDNKLDGVELWVANTDAQVLVHSKCQRRLILGYDVTKGLGAGANPEVGRLAAENSHEQIRNALRGADMVFVAAGMGGGTGTGAAPVIAKIARELGAVTIGIVTRPFTFEGKTRTANATEGLQNLRENVDSLIVISNDLLLRMMGNIPLNEAFLHADEVLYRSVRSITDLILMPALINLDFADVKTIMKDKGTALIGFGSAEGEKMAKKAAEEAVNSKLLDASIRGAKNAIVSIAGGSSMTLVDAHDAIEVIREAATENDMNIIFGAKFDATLGDKMEVTVIATEFAGSDVHRVDGRAKNARDISPKMTPAQTISKIDPEAFKTIKNPDTQKIKDDVENIKEPNLEDVSLIPSFLRRKKSVN